MIYIFINTMIKHKLEYIGHMKDQKKAGFLTIRNWQKEFL